MSSFSVFVYGFAHPRMHWWGIAGKVEGRNAMQACPQKARTHASGMSKSQPTPEPESLPSVTPEQGQTILQNLLKIGKELETPSGIPVARSTTWNNLCDQQLKKIFGSKSPYRRQFLQAGGNYSTDEIESFDALHEKLALIASFIESLDFEIQHKGSGATNPTKLAPSLVLTRQVFGVHGHDEATKLKVARFLERLGLTPIILHEQTDEGLTIIEKFEKHAEVSPFAVILLTPDDTGSARNAPSASQPRARQNVILEMGYFIGKLGRPRVCPLYAAGVELPSDLLGVVYTPLDSQWEIRLANELKAAGFPIDLNRL